MLFVVILNIGISTLSYLTFGSDIKDIILSNLEDNLLSKIVQVSYGVGLLATVPIQMAPVFELCATCTRFDKFFSKFTSNMRIKHYIAVPIALSLVYIVSTTIDSLESYTNTGGASLGLFTVAVFPVLFYHRAFEGEMSCLHKYFNYVLVVSLLVFCTFSTFVSLDHIVHRIDQQITVITQNKIHH